MTSTSTTPVIFFLSVLLLLLSSTLLFYIFFFSVEKRERGGRNDNLSKLFSSAWRMRVTSGRRVLSCFTRYILGKKKEEMKPFGTARVRPLAAFLLRRFVPHRLEDGNLQRKKKRGDEWSRSGAALINDLSFPRSRLFISWPRGISRFLYFVGIQARRIEQFRDIISWKRKRI